MHLPHVGAKHSDHRDANLACRVGLPPPRLVGAVKEPRSMAFHRVPLAVLHGCVRKRHADKGRMREIQHVEISISAPKARVYASVPSKPDVQIDAEPGSRPPRVSAKSRQANIVKVSGRVLTRRWRRATIGVGRRVGHLSLAFCCSCC